MNLPQHTQIIALEGLVFILYYGVSSLLRGEGLSNQPAFEILGLTAAAILAEATLSLTLNPVIFLALVYFIAMRVRLLIDASNHLSALGYHSLALTLSRLALKLRPDMTGRLLALINLGTVHLRRGGPVQAIAHLQSALTVGADGETLAPLSPRYSAICHFNLGMAYRRLGNNNEAVREFRAVTAAFPESVYAEKARLAIRQTMRAAFEKRLSSEGKQENQ
jgi:tetratricopeptide (TPR) repeat protein